MLFPCYLRFKQADKIMLLNAILFLIVTSTLPASHSQAHFYGQQELGCVPKVFGHGSAVCVCNSTYCDYPEPEVRLGRSQYLVYTSSKDGLRFYSERRHFENGEGLVPNTEVIEIVIEPNVTYQTVLGFGGAFTDSACININSLSKRARDHLMKSYFSDEGIRYTMGRMPIGGSDFSTRPYTYDDDHDGDFNLAHFQFAPEDIQHKIPTILSAQGFRGQNDPIKLIASPWSAPAWMKTSGTIHGEGHLKGEADGPYYRTWADYFVKFFQGYQSRNVTFWGLTAQNTPKKVYSNDATFNCMRFTPENQASFIAEHLGPKLKEKGLGDLKIIIGDGPIQTLPAWAENVFSGHPDVKDYVYGVAIHWYSNSEVGHEALDQTHKLFPYKALISSEACTGVMKDFVQLGSWERGEAYAQDIIQDLNHWITSWIDWNLALDQQGGPNWANNFVDSPIIVNSEKDEFYKQPMYYALGHFSKFVHSDSVVIKSSISGSDHHGLTCVTVGREDGAKVMIILNKSQTFRSVVIKDQRVGQFTSEIPARAIQTYIWWEN